MSCQQNQPSNTCCQTNNGNGTGYVIIIVLYILLAIILGAWMSC
ncbi:MAG: sporulation protein YjcZ [Bacilli bacterium]|nr:sporulation protein YjcZ [Bacilli bacterium]